MRNSDLPYREKRRNSTEQDALLTRTQRDFLEGDGSGYSDSQRSKKTTDVSNRLYNSILDFALLYRNRDRLDLSGDVFEPENFERDDAADGARDYKSQVTQPTVALEELIALVYLETMDRSHPQNFEEVLKRGIKKAEDDHVEVTFEVEELFGNYPVREVQEKIIDGEWKDLTEGELRLFAKCLSDADKREREAAAGMMTLESAIDRAEGDSG